MESTKEEYGDVILSVIAAPLRIEADDRTSELGQIAYAVWRMLGIDTAYVDVVERRVEIGLFQNGFCIRPSWLGITGYDHYWDAGHGVGAYVPEEVVNELRTALQKRVEHLYPRRSTDEKL